MGMKAGDCEIQEKPPGLRSLLDNLPGIAFRWRAPPESRFEFVSAGAAALTGRGRPAGRRIDVDLRALIDPADRERVDAAVAGALLSGGSYATSYRLLLGGGGCRWVLEKGRVLPAAGRGPPCIEGFIVDISEQKQAEERARWIATHDALTLLPNRIRLQETLERLLPAGDDEPFALVILDVDDFKRVNDSFGHDAGDAVLCAVSDRLCRALRHGDFIARLGGDEFALVLRRIGSADEALAACEPLLASLRAPIRWSGFEIDCRASLGISLHPAHGESPRDLLKHADLALYASKGAGKSVARVFAPAMRATMQQQMTMLATGRTALAAGRVLPYYQPKVDLVTGRVVGLEALLRWFHPEGGPQLPKGIAACLDDPVVGAAISDVILERVVADMSGWLRAGLDFGHVAVNASAVDFSRGRFEDRLLERLGAAGVPARHLQLEITETVLLSRGGAGVEQALRKISAAGIGIALDDFGTGYASLTHLRQFPIDALKIDRSFVRNLEWDEDAAAIVAAVVDLSRSLGLVCIAEGVETDNQARRLARKGCHHAQGFLYSQAVEAAAVPALIRSCTGAARAA